VDQQGNIQSVGGVNEKIEGFFEICRRKGLSGEQGVLIPHHNRVNLMLCADVREAVADGKFHIHPVRTIDEGLEVLTGVPAGERQEDGSYPADSVHARVMSRLERIAENLKAGDKNQDPDGDDDADDSSGDGLATVADDAGESGGSKDGE
jgi:predicted ATP-dependent protease